MAPTVSVIVPVYKVEAWLPACVESIYRQTYTDFELILVDDGSPDGCPAMCDAYAAKNPNTRVVHQQNQGLGMARNAGLEVATGRYVAFVDSDDTIEPDCLAASVAAMGPGVDVVSWNFRLVSGAPGTEDDYAMPAFACASLAELESYFIDYVMKYNIFGSACNKLYRRAVIEGNHLRFLPILGEDGAFNAVFYRYVGGIRHLGQAFYNYRQDNAGSITHAGRTDVYANMMAKEKYLVEFLDAAGFDTVRAREEGALLSHFSQLTGINTLSYGERLAALRAIIKDDRMREMLTEALQEQPRTAQNAVCLAGLRLRCAVCVALPVSLRNGLTKRKGRAGG